MRAVKAGSNECCSAKSRDTVAGGSATPTGQSSFLSLCLPLKEGYKTFRRTLGALCLIANQWSPIYRGRRLDAVTTVSPRDSHNVPDISDTRQSCIFVLPSSMRFENAVKHTGAFELIQTVCGSSPLPSETAPLLCSACHYPTGDCPARLCPGLPSGMHDGRWPFPTYDQTLPPSCLKMKQKRKPGVERKGCNCSYKGAILIK